MPQVVPQAVLPDETFRIRPWRDSELWFLVHVADDLTQMREAVRVFLGDCHPAQLAAVVSCTPNDRKAREGLRGLIGVVFFARTWLGAGLVAHELAHAAFRVCDRRRMRVRHWAPRPATERLSAQKPMWSADNEEKYCNFLEHLTRDFWTSAYAHRLTEEAG